MEGDEIMKNLFTNDLSLKILSLIISFILWIYLVVMLNPNIEVTISDVPVTYSGHQVLTNNDFMITNQTQEVVTLRLKGPRNLMSSINKSSILAYIDLSGYTNAGTFSLPVHVRLPYEEVSVVEKKPYNLNVIIDKVQTHQFTVENSYIGTPKEGYAVYNPAGTQPTVEVKGPEDLVKTIDKAVVDIDVQNASADIKTNAAVELLNSNGDPVDTTLLTITPETVDITCMILKKKTVPVIPRVEGDTEKYDAKPIDIEAVTILGKEEDIDKINAISTAAVTVGEANVDKDITVSLSIPERIHLEQTDLTSVKVRVVAK